MSVISLNDANFKGTIAEGVVLVDFYADWCGPCKMISPIVEQVSNETDAKVGKINVDENNFTASEYQIMSIPTLIIFKDGQISQKIVGFTSKEQLLDEINKIK